jgi:hypothetical protein
MPKPQPYLERWRLEKLIEHGGNNSSKCTYATNNVYDLRLYCNDRDRKLAYLKNKNMIHQKSKLAFKMFFTTDCLEGCFYLDKAHTQMVFTSKVNPHAIIDAETAELKPPLAGNAISGQTQFTTQGLLQTPNCAFNYELSEVFWSVNGVDAQKTCFLDSEILGSIEASDNGALQALNNRRRSSKAKPQAPPEISIDEVSEPCLDSPRTPTPNEIKPPVDDSQAKPWVGMDTKQREAKRARSLKADTREAYKHELSSPKMTDEERDAIKGRQCTENEIAKGKARELKDINLNLRTDRKAHRKAWEKSEVDRKQWNVTKNAQKPAKLQIFAEDAQTDSFTSHTYFPVAFHDTKSWLKTTGTLEDYSQVRESRKRKANGVVQRVNDRVLKPNLKLKLTSWKQLVAEDETHFAFLQEKFRLDSRNL